MVFKNLCVCVWWWGGGVPSKGQQGFFLFLFKPRLQSKSKLGIYQSLFSVKVCYIPFLLQVSSHCKLVHSGLEKKKKKEQLVLLKFPHLSSYF